MVSFSGGSARSADISISGDTAILWTQNDLDHSLILSLSLRGSDGIYPNLWYGANASNHWGEQGMVDMTGVPTGYSQWLTYARNLRADYLAEYGVEPQHINGVGISHYSLADWSGDHGGAVGGICIGLDDCDGDVLPNAYELARPCLDAATADLTSDPDNDNFVSGFEFGYGTEPCDPDTDGDSCRDGIEHPSQGVAPVLGGDRDPLNAWDFYDVTGDAVIDLSDTLAILGKFGAGPLDPAYDPLFDRGMPDLLKPWRTSASSDGIDLSDALNNLASFGHSCG